jgi:hypothetical protein
LPPTWNWLAVGFTHAAREGEGTAHALTANRTPSAIFIFRLRTLLIIPCPPFRVGKDIAMRQPAGDLPRPLT